MYFLTFARRAFAALGEQFYSRSQQTGKTYEERQRRYNARRDVSYALAEVHSERAEEMRQYKTKRDEQNYFTQTSERYGRFCLSESDERILQSHLGKKHDRSHHEKRSVPHDELRYPVARAENERIELRSKQRKQPHSRAYDQRGKRYYLDGLLYPVGISRAVIITHERLHARTQSVERHADHLQCAHHYRKRRRIITVAVPAYTELEIYIENYLYGALRRGHDERGKSEREHGKHYLRMRAHICRPQTEKRIFSEKESQRPYCARRL